MYREYSFTSRLLCSLLDSKLSLTFSCCAVSRPEILEAAQPSSFRRTRCFLQTLASSPPEQQASGRLPHLPSRQLRPPSREHAESPRPTPLRGLNLRHLVQSPPGSFSFLLDVVPDVQHGRQAYYVTCQLQATLEDLAFLETSSEGEEVDQEEGIACGRLERRQSAYMHNA